MTVPDQLTGQLGQACNRDYGSNPQISNSVVCSLDLSNGDGKASVKVRLVRDGQLVIETKPGYALPLGSSSWWLNYQWASTAASGAYVCELLIDGNVVAQKAFTVAGAAPPPANTPPSITGVSDASGVVTTTTVWIRVSFDDADCNVVGGTWEGATGSGLRRDFGATGESYLMQGLNCSKGHGSLQFSRSCLWTGTWTEYMTLTDASGARSQRFPFRYTCT